jgi:cytoskeleton protein RodZ
MASVGSHLRELRQQRGLSLEELSRATRVAPRYLEALESDRFSALPAPVFTRGFIRAYCQAVGASADEALARYDGRDGAPAPPPRPTVSTGAPAPPAEPEPRSRSAVLVSFVLLVVLGGALFAVALLTQPGRDDRAERRAAGSDEATASTLGAPAPTTSSPSASTPRMTETLPSAAAPAPSPTASSPPSRAATAIPPQTSPAAPHSPAAPTSAAPAAGAPGSGSAAATAEAPRTASPPTWLPNVQAATGGVASPYRLVARVSEPTWIRVRTEDGRSTEETIPAGQIREWVSNRPFVLTVGNAGGVTFELNGRTLPPLGPTGTVVSRIVLPPQ